MNLKKIINKLKEDSVGIVKAQEDPKEQSNTIKFEPHSSNVKTGHIVAGDLNQILIKLDQIDNDKLNSVAEKIENIERILVKETVNCHDPAQINEKISIKIKRAEEFQKKRNFNEALNIYLDILTDYTGSGDLSNQSKFTINNNIGICYLNLVSEKDNVKKAKKFFDKAYSLKEGLEEEKVYLTFSWYYYETKNIDESLKYAKKAIEIKPDYIKAINMVALIREEKGESLDDIIVEFYFNNKGELNEIFHENIHTYLTLGQLFLKNEQIDIAIHYLEEAIKISKEDIFILALLGNAYLLKGLLGKKDAKNININKDIDLKFIKKSNAYFKAAFNIAKSLGLVKSLNSFLKNYALTCSLIGNYEDIYEEIKNAIKIGCSDEEILKYKAKIEAYSGNYVEALNTYGNVPGCKTSSEVSMIYLVEGKFDLAISNIRNELNDQNLDADEILFNESLLAEAFIRKKEFAEAYKVLKKIEKEGRTNWRTKVVWGLYYYNIQNHELANKFYNEAVIESGYHPLTIFETVTFFGLTNNFSEAIQILEEVHEKKLPLIDIFKNYFFRQLIKAYFFDQQFNKAIEVSEEALKNGLPKNEIRDLMANSYIELKRYDDALQIFKEVYSEIPNDFNNVCNIANCLGLLGKVEESIKYFKEALTFKEAENNSLLLLDYCKILILSNNNENALKIAEKARDIDIHNPKSPAHSFYMHVNIRCGETDQLVKYMSDFHSTYPKEDIVQTVKAFETDDDGNKILTDEFKNRINNDQKQFEFGINYYKSNPLPIHFLSYYFKRNLNEIYSWREVYGIPINIDSGNPNIQSTEIENILKSDSVLIDLFSLIILSNLGLIESLFKTFDHIYIPQSLFDGVQNCLIYMEYKNIREIWNILRSNRSIRFVTNRNDIKLFDENGIKIFGESTCDCLNISKAEDFLFCVGDENLKRIARSEKIRVTGIYAILIKLLKNDEISLLKCAESKIKLIKENHSFISYNVGDLLAITENDHYHINDELTIFFNLILRGQPNVLSFIKVFIDTIMNLLINKKADANILSEWVTLFVKTFEKLYVRDFIAEKFPFLAIERRGDLINNVQWTEQHYCLLAITDLYALLEINSKDIAQTQKLHRTICNSISNFDLLENFYRVIIPVAKVKAEQFLNLAKSKNRNA